MGLDQAFGLSFRHHVIAGYQFIMRYYSPGDCIYIFGFSRGAYTARFLAEMLQKIGLLSRGKSIHLFLLEVISFRTVGLFGILRLSTRQIRANIKPSFSVKDAVYANGCVHS